LIPTAPISCPPNVAIVATLGIKSNPETIGNLSRRKKTARGPKPCR
jgi:hypothetical protein